MGEFGKVHERLDTMGRPTAETEPAKDRAESVSGVVEPELMEFCDALQEGVPRLCNWVDHGASTLEAEMQSKSSKICNAWFSLRDMKYARVTKRHLRLDNIPDTKETAGCGTNCD